MPFALNHADFFAEPPSGGYRQHRSWDGTPPRTGGEQDASQDPNHAHRAEVSLVAPSGRVGGLRATGWTV